MKRSLRFGAASAVGLASLAVASPAFAQSNGSDAAGAAAGGLVFLFCVGLPTLIGVGFGIWWIIMLIDVFQRQEYEFPAAGSSSKSTWMIILLVGGLIGFWWVVAPVYYFMVFKKIKRGSIPAPASYPGQTPPPAAPGPQGYAPPPAPPAQPGYAPPPPPAPPAPPVPPAPPAQPAPESPGQEPPAPPAPPAPGE